MSDMKCPVCRTGNIKKYADGQHYACDNEDCPSYDETDERTFDILITTRKALDVAVDGLKIFARIPQPIAEVAKIKLYAIKELEQKDVK